MNLQFITVKDSGDYIVQKANVTYNKQFWRAWQISKASLSEAVSLGCKPPENSLPSLVSLRRETIDGETYWFAYRQVPKSSNIKTSHFPLSYMVSDTSKLLPYQPTSVAHLCDSIVRNGAAADGSDTGTGKTYCALACARDLKYRPGIICKKAGIATWKKVCQFFHISPLFIVNWEYAKSSNFRYIVRTRDQWSGEYIFRWTLPKETLLIFDEAHSASNSTSQNSRIYMASKGIPSISCSATFADRPERLQPLFHVLGVVDKDKFHSWLIERGQGYFIDEREQAEFLSDHEAMKQFCRILYPWYGYRLSYEDPAVKKHFPEVVYQTEIISIGERNEKAQNSLYKTMLSKAEFYKSLGKQAEKMVAEMRYRQQTELLKVAVLRELADNYREQGHSVCIFVNYRETLEYLSKELNTKSLIYGSQEKEGLDREKIIEDFQENRSNIIVSMVEAGGQSISLHDIHGNHPRISLICPTYHSIALKQVLGRTHRAGSKTTPIVKLVYASGTIEEKVAETVNRKLANISALNDGDLMEHDLFRLGV